MIHVIASLFALSYFSELEPQAFLAALSHNIRIEKVDSFFSRNGWVVIKQAFLRGKKKHLMTTKIEQFLNIYICSGISVRWKQPLTGICL